MDPCLRRDDEGGSVAPLAFASLDQCQVIVEVAPVGVGAADQAQFPLALPFLHRLFARDCADYLIMALGVDQSCQSILHAEFRARAFAMLRDARRQVRGHADIERAVRAVRHDVDPAAFHESAASSNP